VSPKEKKDLYYLRTTQSSPFKAILYQRSTELAGHLTTLLGTLLKIKVPRCEVTHGEEHLRREDCESWSCQIEVVVHFAADLSIKLQQRTFKTVFRWPESGEQYDKDFMEDDGETILGSNAVVNMTYMPAVIDELGSKDPLDVDKGVWYKALVSSDSLVEREKEIHRDQSGL
jgi:hypothetical protein